MLTRVIKQAKRSSKLVRRFAEEVKPKEHGSPETLIKDFFGSNPSKSNVLVVRHAQSYGNLRNQLYGHTNYKLTPFGLEQARMITKHLKYTVDKFDTINSSRLIRAMQTANLALDLGLDLGETLDTEEIFDEEAVRAQSKDELGRYEEIIRRDERFNEFNFGPMEGSNIIDMSQQEHYELFRQ